MKCKASKICVKFAFPSFQMLMKDLNPLGHEQRTYMFQTPMQFMHIMRNKKEDIYPQTLQLWQLVHLFIARSPWAKHAETVRQEHSKAEFFQYQKHLQQIPTGNSYYHGKRASELFSQRHILSYMLKYLAFLQYVQTKLKIYNSTPCIV